MVAGRAGEEAHAAVDCAALQVGGAEIEAAEAGERDRARAHRAGFERDVEIAGVEPLVAERARRGADCEHLGMRRGIMVADGAIAGAADDMAVTHDDTADWNFAGSLRGARL